MKSFTTLLLAVGVTACAWKPTPVVMIGPAADMSSLVGEWSGEYYSKDTQRSGTIWFKLEAGRDTAFGDVLMLPRENVVLPEPSAPDVRKATPRVLTIKFVRVRGVEVLGAIEPYPSPDCECLLFTMFRGAVKGDRIEGEFSIIHNGHNSLPQSGTWWARRQPAR